MAPVESSQWSQFHPSTEDWQVSKIFSATLVVFLGFLHAAVSHLFASVPDTELSWDPDQHKGPHVPATVQLRSTSYFSNPSLYFHMEIAPFTLPLATAPLLLMHAVKPMFPSIVEPALLRMKYLLYTCKGCRALCESPPDYFVFVGWAQRLHWYLALCKHTG